MAKNLDKKPKRPRTTVFESPIARTPREGVVATGQNPDEIDERADTKTELKG